VIRGVLCAFCALALGGCGGNGGGDAGSAAGPNVHGFAFTDASAISDGEAIPARYTCDGADVPPTLAWTGAPQGTKELALLLEDPDAPSGTFTHWLVWGIDAAATKLTDRSDVSQGRNDFGGSGYQGPCPPAGQTHHYVFRLLAFDEPLDLRNAADRASFDAAVVGQVIAEALMTATYRRG
jgi:Raf kinase inhibitor-like YbhB/YbcL family protein